MMLQQPLQQDRMCHVCRAYSYCLRVPSGVCHTVIFYSDCVICVRISESWASPKTGRGLDHVRGGLAPVPAVPK